jgi:hypothetical protein
MGKKVTAHKKGGRALPLDRHEKAQISLSPPVQIADEKTDRQFDSLLCKLSREFHPAFRAHENMNAGWNMQA